jgi:crossover junction endodeoxyribonuclease RusA
VIRLTAKDTRTLLARNSVGACTPTSMAAWVNGTLILELPHPPSDNNRTTHYKGRTISTREWRAYKDAVAAVVFASHRPKGWTMFAGDMRLAVEIDWYPPDRRRRDAGNIVKAIGDALTYAEVWADDSQIDFLAVRRCPVEAGGKVVVRVKERA